MTGFEVEIPAVDEVQDDVPSRVADDDPGPTVDTGGPPYGSSGPEFQPDPRWGGGA